MPAARPVGDFSGEGRMWDKAQDRIFALLRLRDDWDGAGASSVSVELVVAALRCLEWLRLADEPSAPHDVYLMPDGNIMLEWQYSDGLIRRVEVEGEGRGQMMVSGPNLATTFRDLSWSGAHPRPRVKPVSREESLELATGPTAFSSEGAFRLKQVEQDIYPLAA
jgi:hypothetical protein